VYLAFGVPLDDAWKLSAWTELFAEKGKLPIYSPPSNWFSFTVSTIDDFFIFFATMLSIFHPLILLVLFDCCLESVSSNEKSLMSSSAGLECLVEKEGNWVRKVAINN